MPVGSDGRTQRMGGVGPNGTTDGVPYGGQVCDAGVAAERLSRPQGAAVPTTGLDRAGTGTRAV